MQDNLQMIDALLSGSLSRQDFEGFLASLIPIREDNKSQVEALSLKYMRKVCKVEPRRITMDEAVSKALDEGIDF